MDQVLIRPIEPEDNAVIARIIRDSLTEFGANKPGTVFYDQSTDHLYELFRKERSAYFIALIGDRIVGGGGIYPTAGLPGDTAELVKLYLLPLARGTGIGKKIMDKATDFARELGYSFLYLETMPELTNALNVYERNGYEYLNGPLMQTEHTGCTIWMKKTI